MGQIFKFLQALTRMAKKGDIKIDDAYKAAKQEFGEVSDLLKLQINKIFKESKAPSIKQPKKEGEVIEASFKPGMDKRGKIIDESPSQASGIMKTDEAVPLMKKIEDVKQNIKGMSENNPKTFRMSEEQRNALGYPNRMIEGIIRTAAREILSKKGIDVSKADPIDTFADIFGVNSLERLEDVSDELLSAQDYKQLNSILQKNELYDVTPKSGLNLGQSDEIEELTEFDPTGRKPSAMGGRIGYQIGGPAFDATNPIYGSSAITVTPDTILGPQGNQIQAQTGVNPTLQGSQNRNPVLQRMQQNQANQFDFGKHAQVSEAMAGKTGKGVIPEYGMQTGYDFQEKSNMNPIASSILASGYQLGQEGLRALNPMGDNFLNFKKAYETANQQAGENIEGILTAHTGTISAEQQANRNKYLESVGQQPDAATPTGEAGSIITDGDSKYRLMLMDLEL